MVYIIEGGNYYKIGYSKNPYERLADLQVGSPSPLTLVAIVAGTRSDEKRLHIAFEESRHHGEWFKKTKELDKLIEAHKVAPIKGLKIIPKPSPLKGKKLTISDAERKRRSDHAKAMIASGKMGGRFGKLGGRPRSETGSKTYSQPRIDKTGNPFIQAELSKFG